MYLTLFDYDTLVLLILSFFHIKLIYLYTNIHVLYNHNDQCTTKNKQKNNF